MTQLSLKDLQGKLETQEVPNPKVTRANINQALSVHRGGTAEEIRDALEIGDLEREKLSLINEILNHPEFEQLINEGKITFGMVKPKRDAAKKVQGTDEEVTQMVIEAIKPPLQTIIEQPLWLPKEVMEPFYEHLKPLDEGRVLDRVVGFMTGGAVTVLILYSEEGNAIAEWRTQMGRTSTPLDEEGTTLRHQFNTGDVGNNVVHGSDSPENVKREVGFIKQLLANFQA